MLGLAKRFNLPLTDVLGGVPAGAQYTICFEGKYYPVGQAALDFKPVLADPAAQLAAAGDLTPYDRLTPEQRRRAAYSSTPTWAAAIRSGRSASSPRSAAPKAVPKAPSASPASTPHSSRLRAVHEVPAAGQRQART